MNQKALLSEDLSLEDMRPDDHAAILDLWNLAGLHARPYGRDSRAAFERQLAAGRQRVVGLKAGQRVVGVVVLTHDGRKGWINRLAVHPDYQRRGVASRLIEEAERWFREDVGLDIWSALITPDNHASQAFFRANGYEETSMIYARKRVNSDV